MLGCSLPESSGPSPFSPSVGEDGQVSALSVERSTQVKVLEVLPGSGVYAEVENHAQVFTCLAVFDASSGDIRDQVLLGYQCKTKPYVELLVRVPSCIRVVQVDIYRADNNDPPKAISLNRDNLLYADLFGWDEACRTPVLKPTPTPLPTPQPSPQPSPEPSPQPSPKPTPTPWPTPEPTPLPTPQPTPTPEPEKTPFCHVSNKGKDGNHNIQEEQMFGHPDIPPGHIKHFNIEKFCPPDYLGYCDGRSKAVECDC
jgi:hypothetical protein